MRQLAEKESFNLVQKTDEAGKIAGFYGFSAVLPPKVTQAEINATKDIDPTWGADEKAALLREFSEARGNSLPSPLMLFMQRPFPGTNERKKRDRLEYELTIIGSHRSVSECLIIQATKAIIENAGWKNISVRINSLGNKDSVADFERKMGNFIRKRMEDFPVELRQLLKKDPFTLTKDKDPKYNEWRECIPQSVDCLSEQSRLHLKETLEFMETIGVPYIFDSSLIGDIKMSSEIVFEIVSNDGEVLARGSRWNRLSRRLQFKKEVPSVSVTINAKALKVPKISSISKTKPNFYLIQFGPEAKMKSFIALEELRKSGIAVNHSLGKDKLMNQMYSVEQSKVPYIILIGQKEAIDNVAVIRNSTTRAQHIVPLKEIGEFIKKSPLFKFK